MAMVLELNLLFPALSCVMSHAMAYVLWLMCAMAYVRYDLCGALADVCYGLCVLWLMCCLGLCVLCLMWCLLLCAASSYEVVVSLDECLSGCMSGCVCACARASM